MMRRKKVTLTHIAEKLGLSIQTVSKALTGKAGMSEETRSEVVQLAKALGYLTKDQKNAMAYERISPYPLVQRRFVLLNNQRSLNFNRLLLSGLHDRFTEFGHKVEPLCIPPDLKPQEFNDWVETTGLLYAEGVFIAPHMTSTEMEELLLRLPLPRILLNFPPHESKVDSVIWDVYEAVYQSVKHLQRAGHQRIMYVGDTASQRGFRLRWQAFQEAMLEEGLVMDPEQHVTEPYERDDKRWPSRLIDRYQDWKPTAMICAVDEQVSPAYYALQNAGVEIPRACSFVGILNEQTDQLPSMSRPLLLIKESGYRAADRMLWRIANPTSPFEHIRIRGDFFKGSTTATLRNPILRL
jgi:LacI family transcriptional regulator